MADEKYDGFSPPHHTHNSEPKTSELVHTGKSAGKNSKWMYAGIVVAFIIGFLVSAPITGYMTGMGSPNQTAASIVSYINTNLAQGGTASLVSAGEVSGIYKITISYLGNEIPVYSTKDGKFFITGVMDTGEEISSGVEEPANTPKTDRPDVNLFVMSQCPYGVQAEGVMEPIVELLGNKINFGLKFIASGTAASGFSSLHGQPEVDEDIRQACIIKHYPEKLFSYLSCANADYRNIGSVWENCSASAGIDTEKIKTCFNGDEGKTLLAENIKLADKFGVGGSPTLMINNITYNGARSAEAFKQAICSAFNTPPAECSQTINATASSAPVTGGCG
jgi:hypothetical protein